MSTDKTNDLLYTLLRLLYRITEERKLKMSAMRPSLQPRCGHGKKGDYLTGIMYKEGGRGINGVGHKERGE